jgi:hypothetical protein
MDTPQTITKECDITASTNALLTEILTVLKKIDGRMQIQDSRITSLEKTADPERCLAGILSRSNSFITSGRVQDLYAPEESHRDQLYTLNSALEDHESLARQTERESLSSEGNSNSTEVRANTRGKMQSLDSVSSLGRVGTFDTIPPLTERPDQTGTSSDTKNENNDHYTKYPPPPRWISTRGLETHHGIEYGLPEARALWDKFVGDSWKIPPDGRVELSFQQHLLERLKELQALKWLTIVAEIFSELEYQKNRAKRGSFVVSDFDIDPSFEVSGADYRAAIGAEPYKEGPLSHPRPVVSLSTAPWKRIM